ncbi:MAG: FHA domain-containing protein [Rikenellaceae bacterium]|nr:FHA domain-containing protein [Rikenellaceae bacterium]
MRTVNIGRNSSNDIIIRNAKVSSSHAVLTVYAQEKVTVRDLNTVAGTYVNGMKINKETELKKGDFLRIAQHPVDWMKFIYHNMSNTHVFYTEGSNKTQVTELSKKKTKTNFFINTVVISSISIALLLILFKLYVSKPEPTKLGYGSYNPTSVVTRN